MVVIDENSLVVETCYLLEFGVNLTCRKIVTRIWLVKMLAAFWASGNYVWVVE